MRRSWRLDVLSRLTTSQRCARLRSRSCDADRNRKRARSFRSLPFAQWRGWWPNQVRRSKERSRASFFIACLVRINRTHGQSDSAARRKFRGHGRFARRARLHKIVENAVCDRFIEGALVSVGSEIKLQRLAFDAERLWHVLDYDLGKVSLTRHRTERSEIRRFKTNSIIASRRIRKSLELRFSRR